MLGLVGGVVGAIQGEVGDPLGLFRVPGRAGKAPWPGGGPAVDSPSMIDVDEQGRPEPPLAGDETATLLGFLDYQRATLAWKCAGWTRPACGRPSAPRR